MGSFGPHLRQAVDWVRYCVDRLVLLPAADLLPRRWALAIAEAAGFVDGALMPHGRTAWREVAACTWLRGLPLFVAGCRRVAGPSRDLVHLRRMKRGREHPSQRRIVEVNAEPVRALVAAGTPFLAVSGHFAYAPMMAVWGLRVPEAGVYATYSAVPAWRLSPRVLRERLQNAQQYPVPQILTGRRPEERLTRVGEGNVVAAMLKVLARRGGASTILIDAWWEGRPDAHRRPFAGLADKGFALGAATIARHAQCLIVMFVATEQADGSILIEWGDPIESPARTDAASDVRVTDRLVDELERAVARSPLQYYHPIGFDRRWDAERGAWTQDEGPAVPVLAERSS